MRDGGSVMRSIARLVRASQVLRTLLVSILVLIGLAIIVGLTTLAQLGGYKSETARLRSDLSAAHERLGRLEQNIAQLTLRSFEASPTRQPQLPIAPNPVTLNAEEIALVRNFIKLAPGAPAAPPTINLGDVIAEARLLPIPEPIVDKVPRLRGARFTTDRNQAIIIVRSGSNRAEAILLPTD